MSQYGDKYTYTVQTDFDAKGYTDFTAASRTATAASNDMTEALALVRAASGQAAVGLGATAKAADQVGRAAHQASHQAARGMSTFNQVAWVGVNTLEDMQFGSRAVGNNLVQLATILTMRANPAVAGFVAVATGLTTVFGRKYIDQMLAYAGVLDENIVKGMERASGATETFTERLSKLREEFADAGKPAIENAAAISQAFIDAGREAEDAVARMAAALADPDIDRKREELEAKFARLADGLAKAEMGAIPLFGDGAARQLRGQLAEVERQLQALADSGGKALADLRREAVTSDDALRSLADTVRAAGQDDLADALDAQTAAAKATAKVIKEAEKEATKREEARKKAHEEAAKEAEKAAVAVEKAEGAAERATQANLDKYLTLEEAITKAKKAAEDARQAAERGDIKAAQSAAKSAERYGALAEKIRETGRAAEEAALRQMAAIDAAREHAERAERGEAVNSVIDAFAGSGMVEEVGRRMQSRVRAGQGVGGAAEDVGGELVQFLVKRGGISAETARGVAAELTGEQGKQIQAALDQQSATEAVMRESLAGSQLLTNMYERQQQMMARFMVEMEKHRRRIEAHDRRFAPMRRMQGNSLGGFF